MSAMTDPFCGRCGAYLQAQFIKCPACGALIQQSTSASDVLPPGFMLNANRYKITELVGRGGYGKVYKAYDGSLKRDVAIKEIDLKEESVADAEKKLNSFRKEADILANIRYPNCPIIYDYFSQLGNVYLAMEFIDGITLEYKLIQNPSFSLLQIIDQGLILCEILGYLHNQKIIFRDLKPSNIMIRTNDKRIFLIDFGIARIFDPQQNKKDTHRLGTPGFTAPEQYNGDTKPKSDVYSLGMVFYQLMTGKDPTDYPPFTLPDLRLTDLPILPVEDEAAYTAMIQLVNAMRKKEIKKRPDIKEVEKRLEKAQELLHSQRPTPVEPQDTPMQLPPKSPRGHLYTIYRGHNGAINALAWTSTNNTTFLASASDDATVQIWQAFQGQWVATYKGHEREVNALTWSPDSKRMASVGKDRQLHIWDTATGQNLYRWEGHKQQIRTVAWSPDGNYIATGGDDNYVCVWNAHNGALRRRLLHEDHILSVAWSPDSTRIASGGHNCIISIWDMTTEMVPMQIKGHKYAVSTLAWSPDGTLIMSGSWDKTVRIWDWVTAQPVGVDYSEHKGLVNAVSFFTWNANLYIASASTNKTVHVQELFTKAPSFIYEGHNTELWALACSPSGECIASAGKDQIVHVWQAV